METLLRDIRYGIRTLLKRPGLTAIAVLTLALGIGANTAIFSVVNAVLLRSLPYPNPEQLVRVGGANLKTGVNIQTFSPPDFYDWRDRNHVFEGMAAYDGWSPSLTGAGEPERISAARVSANFFDLLKVNPAYGRTFLPHEEQRGNHMVVILSHDLWQRRFGSDPNVVGRNVTLNNQSYMVIGVMPAGFESPRFSGVDFEKPELWAPFAPDLKQWGRNGRSVDAAIARLKTGVTLAQAQAEMAAIGRQLQQQNPEMNANQGVSVANLHEQFIGSVRTALTVFLVAVAFVLLIACANVANLLLTLAAARHKDIGIRVALGAGRRRIVRQLLAESLLLSLGGAIVGLLLAVWATSFLVALGSESIPHLGTIGLDIRALGFTSLLAVFTGITFGLAPAIQVFKIDLNESLKEGPGKGAAGAGRGGLRSALVVSQVALSLILLVGAGLLFKSFLRLREVNPGFNPQNVLTMNVFLPGAKYPNDENQIAFFDQALEHVRTVPGIESVGVVSNLPISGNFDRVGFYVEDHPVFSIEYVPDIERYSINADYFQAMRIPLREGRSFSTHDTMDAPQVAIINETTARAYWQHETAIGKRIRTDPKHPWRTVVGVVSDVRHYALETAPNMQLYLPYQQAASQAMTFVARSSIDPEKQIVPMQTAIWAVDRDQPVYNIKTMPSIVSESVARRRFIMTLIGIFAAVAMFLAMVGIYGVMSYSVTQRTHEIGIRMALGARQLDVLKLVVRRGMTLVVVGVGLGLLGAIGLTRVMSTLLFGVTARDPVTFVAVATLLTLVAFVACYLPARRATRVDPLVALRYE